MAFKDWVNSGDGKRVITTVALEALRPCVYSTEPSNVLVTMLDPTYVDDLIPECYRYEFDRRYRIFAMWLLKCIGDKQIEELYNKYNFSVNDERTRKGLEKDFSILIDKFSRTLSYALPYIFCSIMGVEEFVMALGGQLKINLETAYETFKDEER